VLDCIEKATLAFEKLLLDFWVMRFKLEMKFDQVAASSNPNRKDLMALIDLQIRTINATTKMLVDLQTLAGLANSVE
jgi:hypothetical protein